MYSRITVFFILLCTLGQELSSKDILYNRIIKYNKLDHDKIRLDSARIFYNLKFSRSEPQQNVIVEIIKVRNQPDKSSSFFWMIALLLFAIIRYKSSISFAGMFSGFFSFKSALKRPANALNNFFIGVAFICLISYFIFQLVKNFLSTPSSLFVYLSIVFFVILVLLYKYISYHLVIFIFNLRNKVNDISFIFFEVMYIFVFISLPALFLTTLTNYIFFNPILLGVLAFFVLMMLFMYFKIITLNFHLLTRNVFNLLIYLYVVEIIPILLFLKYLKLL